MGAGKSRIREPSRRTADLRRRGAPLHSRSGAKREKEERAPLDRKRACAAAFGAVGIAKRWANAMKHAVVVAVAMAAMAMVLLAAAGAPPGCGFFARITGMAPQGFAMRRCVASPKADLIRLQRVLWSDGHADI
jgi:hypothetical protein